VASGRCRDERHKPPPITDFWLRRQRVRLVQKSGSELKLVYPQEKAPPEEFERLDFRHFFLQPMDGPDTAANTEAAIEYCLRHPLWRLSLQTHKLVGLR
jgi:organic radical activating enzyme